MSVTTLLELQSTNLPEGSYLEVFTRAKLEPLLIEFDPITLEAVGLALRQGRLPGREVQELVNQHLEQHGTQVKRGPVPRSLEECEALEEEWLKWKKNGYSQDMFATFKGWKSRSILSKCLKQLRN